MVTTAGLRRAGARTNDRDNARAAPAGAAPVGPSAGLVLSAGAAGAAIAAWCMRGAILMEIKRATIMPVTSQPTAASQWIDLRFMVIPLPLFLVALLVRTGNPRKVCPGFRARKTAPMRQSATRRCAQMTGSPHASAVVYKGFQLFR